MISIPYYLSCDGEKERVLLASQYAKLSSLLNLIYDISITGTTQAHILHSTLYFVIFEAGSFLHRQKKKKDGFTVLPS